MLHEKIQEEIKIALKEKNKSKLNALRSALSAITNQLVAEKRRPSEILNDDDVLMVIKKQVKQREDSIEQFKKGGRNDLAKLEQEELEYLSKFLPEQMGEEEIKKIVQYKIKELGITDKSKMGILIGLVMKETKGNAAGTIVKKIVNDSLD